MVAQLLHKTRPYSTPQGKPGVYFACHPADYKGYFERIADQILKIADCAVFCYEPGEVEQDEEYYLNLSRMQLIVMPVTTRLLHLPNRAMDIEFAYAIEHHVPVLPLMQERGLEEKYQQKFGDLQFLDKYNTDPTAIPYAEKLKKYLESVLVGEELAAQVRAAFDAYVFLSYRKKDRKYAQELMRLLHRDETCRDIAIWYDEFLMPGENFNDSIRAALDKSDLFVLTVTPNLVNEPNYIIEHEYPMAKDVGKPILPVEMVTTDAEALRAYYADIPDSVDPRNERLLTDAVLAALSTLARRENDSDPQHNFFVGLAYLAGIDVEVDRERAVRLITGAAETGLTEAMEKLVSMYETGEGVQRDYHEAIRWREKLVEQARIAYEAIGTEAAADAYFFRMWDLGDAWTAVSNIEAAKVVYETMRLLAETWVRRSVSNSNLRKVAISYDVLGTVCCGERAYEEAKVWCIKAQEILAELAKTGLIQFLQDLSRNYIHLGDVFRNERDFAEAKIWYSKSLDLLLERARTGAEEELRNVADVCYDLGEVCQAAGDLTEAKKYYMQALCILQELATYGNKNTLRRISVVYGSLGGICGKEQDYTGAKSWYLKQHALLLPLTETKSIDDQRALAISYSCLAEILQEEGNFCCCKRMAH